MLVVYLLLAPLAQATAQCPPEAGHKPEWISRLAWRFLPGGLIGGLLLAGCVFARSKGALLRWRLLAALPGALLMLGVWVGCGLLAGHLILQC